MSQNMCLVLAAPTPLEPMNVVDDEMAADVLLPLLDVGDYY